MSHTPGPWHRNIKPATKYNTVWSGRNTHVAHVDVVGLPAAEVEANIRLIAKAPEMREMLAGLLTGDQPGPNEWEEMIRSARALLAEIDGTDTRLPPGTPDPRD